MNRKTISMIAYTALCAMVTVMISAAPGDGSMTKSKDTTVVNTKLIAKEVKGYRGATPVKIYIRKDKVVKVEALPNRETPKYFQLAKAVLNEFNGKTVAKAAELQVDGVSGATFSSEALVQNVKEGLKYYKKHR
ncbi:MAG: FMN-binding protein [Prevotella sp.]|nr:FMN-binding protein [Prevotella sp.]